MVTEVQVTVLDEEGKVLEKGEGIKGEGKWWEFASNTEGKTIMTEACYLPGRHQIPMVKEICLFLPLADYIKRQDRLGYRSKY
jgi:hypothetical protein